MAAPGTSRDHGGAPASALNTSKLWRGAEVLLAGVAVFYASLTVVAAVGLVSTPYQFNYEEGNILNAGVRIIQGQNPYPNPQQWPVVLNPYGPMAYYATAAVTRITGLSFTGPRLMIVASGVIASALIALLLLEWGCGVPAAIAFGAMFLWVPTAVEWLPVLRVDFIGLAATLAGIYVLERWPRWWLLAAVLFTAAIAAKPTFIAAPAAVVLHAVAQTRGRDALRIAAATVTVTSVIFVTITLLTHGAFSFHLFRTHPDPYSWEVLGQNLREIAVAQLPAIVLALVLLVHSVRHRRLSLPLAYLFLALLTTCVTAGKAGSDTNHLLEVTAVLCLAGGLGWNSIVSEKRQPAFAILAALALVTFLVWQYRPLAPRGRNGCEQAYNYLRTHGERILSEDVGAVVLAGKTVQISNPFVYTQLAVRGAGSDAELQDRVRRRWFDVIVLAQPPADYERNDPDNRWSRAMLRAVEENYRLVEFFECPAARVAMVPR